jgi:hypothetical protein
MFIELDCFPLFMLFSVSISENPSFRGEPVGTVGAAGAAGGAGAAAEPKAPATEAGALVIAEERADVGGVAVGFELVGAEVVGAEVAETEVVGVEVAETEVVGTEVAEVAETAGAPDCLLGGVEGLVNPSYNPKLLVLKAIIISNTKTTPKILLQ